MFNNKSVVAIVPARGGSKGIYKKNITLLNGKPLIEYTLDVALKSSYIDEVIVSTDDLEIEMISKNIGAKIVKRPPAISTDSSLTLDTIKHVIKQVGFINDETIIILLQATSPLREQHHIKDSLEFFTNSYICKGFLPIGINVWSYAKSCIIIREKEGGINRAPKP